MPRQAPALDLVLGQRPRGVTLTSWFCDELRAAIVSGRLSRGARLPATRDLATRFRFDSKDSSSNAFKGWMVDDVVVTR